MSYAFFVAMLAIGLFVNPSIKGKYSTGAVVAVFGAWALVVLSLALGVVVLEKGWP